MKDEEEGVFCFLLKDFLFSFSRFSLLVTRYCGNVKLCSNGESKRDLLRPLIGVLLSAAALSVSLQVPNISTIFSILGGTCASFTCKLEKYKEYLSYFYVISFRFHSTMYDFN